MELRAIIVVIGPSMNTVLVFNAYNFGCNYRVISLGSENGSLLDIISPSMQQKFTSPNLTIDRLSYLMDQYMRLV